jgi:hypothetical protein
MNTTVISTQDFDDKTAGQIEALARMSGKSEKAVMQDLVKTGLKAYHSVPTKSAKAVLDLIKWAEQVHLPGKARDLSTNHNKYAWNE